MRSISIYFVWDNISEMVLTAFTAVNDKIAVKSFTAMIQKSQVDYTDVELYKVSGCHYLVPDNAVDLSELVSERDVVRLEVTFDNNEA